MTNSYDPQVAAQDRISLVIASVKAVHAERAAARKFHKAWSTFQMYDTELKEWEAAMAKVDKLDKQLEDAEEEEKG